MAGIKKHKVSAAFEPQYEILDNSSKKIMW